MQLPLLHLLALAASMAAAAALPAKPAESGKPAESAVPAPLVCSSFGHRTVPTCCPDKKFAAISSCTDRKLSLSLPNLHLQPLLTHAAS